MNGFAHLPIADEDIAGDETKLKKQKGRRVADLFSSSTSAPVHPRSRA
ncbi:hypothetical protein [Mesorhizobium sanjuanii]|nr:hypothetical protein [Mesorhizobium sanjuanii]